MTVCFMIVMYGNPFKDYYFAHLKKHIGHEGSGIRVLKYNDDFMYFYEFPLGISGVVYDKKVLIFDKASTTRCAHSLYESVFMYKNKKFISKCFLSEHMIRKIFSNALQIETYEVNQKGYAEKVDDISRNLLGLR